MENEQSSTIQEITFTKRNKETKYRLHSKIQALEALAKHTGIYEKDNDQRKSLITIDKINYIVPENGNNAKSDN
jgi:hypothetical protein